MEPLPVFIEPTYSPVSTPEIAKKYPLIICAGARVPYYSNSEHRDLPWLKRFMPEPVVKLAPTDARARGLQEGDKVRITSPVNGTGIVMKLEITETVRPGMIDILHGWGEANVNELLPREFDPISGFSAYKEGLCEVAKEEETSALAAGGGR
jgi:anaerobic selenocysteine-containing dehydrogenase